MNNFFKIIVTALILNLSFSINTSAQTQKPSDESFIVESYYKVKWGYVDEFISLYKKNHYPLLKKALDKGDLLSIKAEKPLHHDAEESRWDFRVTLVFKNTQLAFDPNLTESYKKALYPDLDKLTKEEQHRFEILIAHWDVPVSKVDLEK
jgi:hypothetical protein